MSQEVRKPPTPAFNPGYCHKQILPWFKGNPISDITRQDILQWYATRIAADSLCHIQAG